MGSVIVIIVAALIGLVALDAVICLAFRCPFEWSWMGGHLLRRRKKAAQAHYDKTGCACQLNLRLSTEWRRRKQGRPVIRCADCRAKESAALIEEATRIANS